MKVMAKVKSVDASENGSATCEVVIDSDIIKTSYRIRIDKSRHYDGDKQKYLRYLCIYVPNEVINALKFLNAEIDYSVAKIACYKAMIKAERVAEIKKELAKAEAYEKSPCHADFKVLTDLLTPHGYNCQYTSKEQYVKNWTSARCLTLSITKTLVDSQGHTSEFSAYLTGKDCRVFSYRLVINRDELRGNFKNMIKIANTIRDYACSSLSSIESKYKYQNDREMMYLKAEAELGMELDRQKDDLIKVNKVEDRPNDQYYNGLRGVEFFRREVNGVARYDVNEIKGMFSAEQMRKIIEIALWSEFSEDVYTFKPQKVTEVV